MKSVRIKREEMHLLILFFLCFRLLATGAISHSLNKFHNLFPIAWCKRVGAGYIPYQCALNLDHGIRVMPSTLLPSFLAKPTGSSNEGTTSPTGSVMRVQLHYSLRFICVSFIDRSNKIAYLRISRA